MGSIWFRWNFCALIICASGLIESRNRLRPGKMSIGSISIVKHAAVFPEGTDSQSVSYFMECYNP